MTDSVSNNLKKPFLEFIFEYYYTRGYEEGIKNFVEQARQQENYQQDMQRTVQKLLKLTVREMLERNIPMETIIKLSGLTKIEIETLK